MCTKKLAHYLHSDVVSESANKRHEKTLKVMCFIDSKKIIDIFDWVVDVNWRIWFLDLINHGNDHTAQERPVLIMLIRRNAVEVSHIVRIEKRGGDLFLEKIDTLKVSYVTTSLKMHAVKSFKQVHPVYPQGWQPWPSGNSVVWVPSPKRLSKHSMMSSRILTPGGQRW